MVAKFLIMIALVFGAVFSLGMANPHMVLADDEANRQQICSGANLSGGTTCESTSSISKIVGVIINILSWIVGLISIIMIIIGGFKFVTSGGAPDKAKSARSTIVYALIGLVVVVLAQTIIKYVISRVTPHI